MNPAHLLCQTKTHPKVPLYVLLNGLPIPIHVMIVYRQSSQISHKTSLRMSLALRLLLRLLRLVFLVPYHRAEVSHRLPLIPILIRPMLLPWKQLRHTKTEGHRPLPFRSVVVPCRRRAVVEIMTTSALCLSRLLCKQPNSRPFVKTSAVAPALALPGHESCPHLPNLALLLA